MEQVVSFLFKYRAAVFSKGEFGFAARPSLWLILSLLTALAILVYFLYSSSSLRLESGWRVTLVTLRCLLFVVIFLCLMRPVVVVPSVVPGTSYVGVLMDDSSSMRLSDEGGGSRLDTLKRLMVVGGELQDGLNDKFKLRQYGFAEGLTPVAGAVELEGTGERTDLSAALNHAVRDAAGLPLAGLVILTDGANNSSGDLTGTIVDLRSRGVPVFAIGLGATKLKGDVELVRAVAPRRVLAESPVTAELLVRATGVERQSLKIDLLEDSHHLRSQEVPLSGEASIIVRFTFTPSSKGVHRYSFVAQAGADEPVVDNNSRELLIEVIDEKPRILHIEGEPRWEYGKLRQASTEEKNLVLVSVLRSADGKFYRQGIETGDELASGFPRSEEEIFGYKGLMLGSVEATFFTFDQLRAIEQFVSRRGGTVLALGGVKSFSGGGYASTPLADLLPVYLRSENSTPGQTQSFKAVPAARGQDHPVVRLAENPDESRVAWERMPAITVPEVIADTKPGATLILEARSLTEKNRTVPLLVEQRYGRGRVMALLTSDTWRWRMMLESKDKSYETFWRAMWRYLVEGVRDRVEATTERSYYGVGEEVRIRAEVADERFINVARAQVLARVSGPAGVTELPLKPHIDGEFEGYSGVFSSVDEGRYEIEVTAKLADNSGKQAALIGSGRSSFLVGPLNREAQDAAQNRDLLRRLAVETGGQYYTPDQADALVEDLSHTEGAGSIRETRDLWDMPVNFLLLIALASAEWFVRKRKGLA